MSQLIGLSKIENINDSSVSNIHLSFDQDLFSNYLEPNQNDIFDTRRFSLQPRNCQVLNTATPKVMRSSTPICSRSKMTPRVNSERLIPKSTFRSLSQKNCSQKKLVKKVENLEKKQELWRERANVWDKERKTYKKALDNVNFIQVNPAVFYKNQLESWKAKSYLKKVSEDLSNNPVQELRNIFEWICAQPDSVPFKSIKLSFNAIASKIDQIEELFENSGSSAVQELSSQNEKLNEQLVKIEKKLEEKVQDLKNFKLEVQDLQQALTLKDEEIKTLNEGKEGSKQVDSNEYIRLESELEEKSYEIIIIKTENKRLASDLAQSHKSNEFYIKTIDELKEKLKNSRIEAASKTSREKENFSMSHKSSPQCESSTQTTSSSRLPKKRIPKRNPELQDFIFYTSCMASAIEALIDSR